MNNLNKFCQFSCNLAWTVFTTDLNFSTEFCCWLAWQSVKFCWVSCSLAPKLYLPPSWIIKIWSCSLTFDAGLHEKSLKWFAFYFHSIWHLSFMIYYPAESPAESATAFCNLAWTLNSLPFWIRNSIMQFSLKNIDTTLLNHLLKQQQKQQKRKNINMNFCELWWWCVIVGDGGWWWWWWWWGWGGWW